MIGEPSGTAGAPMLNILQKNNLCNALIIVTRYFGGILLGTGGLVRCYSAGCLGAIEKAIFEANLGVTPNNNGEVVFIVIPPLTEDRRKDLVKQVKQLAEEAKIALRNIRQDANKALSNLELPEDEEKRGNERVQELINEYNKIVDEKLKVKENELMSI